MYETADELSLRRLSDAYACAVDRRDLLALGDCFTPDGRLLFQHGSLEPREYRGRDGLAAVISEVERFDLTLHHVTTCSIVLDAHRPRGTVCCIAHHLRHTEHGCSDLALHVRYEDVYGRGADARWRFVERLANVVFSERAIVRRS